MANEMTTFNPNTQEMELLKKTIAADLNVNEFQMFLQYCKAAGLNPFLKQVYASKRGDRVTFQTGIDAFRARASETGQYEGQLGPYWCGMDGKWADVWLASNPPAAAKIAVYRAGFKEPVWGIAKYSEYVQLTREGAPNTMWKKMPANQLAKCAEALALRKAFPEKLGGIYTDTEMEQADSEPINISQKPQSKFTPTKLTSQPEPQSEPAPMMIDEPAPGLSGDFLSQITDMLAEMFPTEKEAKVKASWFKRLEQLGNEKGLEACTVQYKKFLDMQKGGQ